MLFLIGTPGPAEVSAMSILSTEKMLREPSPNLMVMAMTVSSSELNGLIVG